MMNDMTKIYSVSPPGLMMRPDMDTAPEYKEHLPIAMAYVPRQVWRDIYDSGKGIMRGTIFAELDKPFMGAGHK